ncbi:hypothetical protein WAX74_03445 [Psychrobacillus sp. FJAT-51614]|uniref:Uncharacterized protein n=1 Tax=Psychrobacillus mangrovi TaxID=3117745 RepID=A0ABU8F129_9BACI
MWKIILDWTISRTVICPRYRPEFVAYPTTVGEVTDASTNIRAVLPVRQQLAERLQIQWLHLVDLQNLHL